MWCGGSTSRIPCNFRRPSRGECGRPDSHRGMSTSALILMVMAGSMTPPRQVRVSLSYRVAKPRHCLNTLKEPSTTLRRL